MARRRDSYLGGSTILQPKKPKRTSAERKSRFADSRYDQPPLSPEEQSEREAVMAELLGGPRLITKASRKAKRK